MNLIKIWKTAQKMRTFFDLKTQNSGNLDTIRALSDTVMKKIRYIFECNLTGKVEDSSAKKNWKLLAKLSSEIVTDVGKDASAVNQMSTSVLQAQKLKAMVQFKKKIAQSKQRFASITEKILKFLQSDILIEDVLKVCELRKSRSTLRIAGINLFSTSLSPLVTPRSAIVALSCFSSVMRKLDDFDNESSGRHYLQGLQGCHSGAILATKQAFENVFEICKDLLSKAIVLMEDKSAPMIERTVWSHVIVSLLQAIFIDFRADDVSLLVSSKITEFLEVLLDVSDQGVRSMAWTSFEVS